MPDIDVTATIDVLDLRRDIGGCDCGMFVYGLLGMFCNLVKTLYTYILTPTTILVVYLLCYMQFGSYIYTIGKIIELDATSRIPHISNK